MAEYRRCLTDFFTEGLQDGLRLAYVSSDGADAARADLADLSDLDRLLAAGALHVLSARDIYGAGGPVDPERVVASVAAATEQALADGFGGLAVSANATELVGTPAHQDAFARCEFLVDRYMASHPLSALCGYGLELGNDTVAEFAVLHASGPSNEAPLQVFGCADGVIGLAGECDPVGVAALGRVLPRLRAADGRDSRRRHGRRRVRRPSAAADARPLRPWKRDRSVAAVSPAVRGPADGVAAGGLAAVGKVGSAGMRTGAAHGGVGHVHEAGFYSSDTEFLALIVPFVTGGIAAGEPVVIGYDDRKCDLLRAELARPDAVSFIADTRLYATPAGAIEAYRQQFERHVAAGAEQIRIAGDVPHEGNGGRFAGWDRYESAVNVVWQDYPVYSRCLYDATTVADRVRDVVQRTHRRLLTADGGATASPHYQEVADFERLPPSTDPLEATRPAFALVDPSSRKTRHRVAEAARGRINAAAFDELLVAVSEAVLNAHLHGRRPITVTAWTGTDRIVVRVHDNGPGPADPLTGLIPAPGGPAGPGLGLWLIHQLTNIDIALLTGTDGFTVRLRGGSPPSPGRYCRSRPRNPPRR